MTRTESTDYTAIRSLFEEFQRHHADFAYPGETIDLAAYLMYASYISRNADTLGVSGFDPKFGIDSVHQRLGNDYVATEFLAAYSELESRLCRLPRLELDSRSYFDLQREIVDWAGLLSASGLTLEEGPDFDTARAVARAMEDAFTAGTGRLDAEIASYAPLAKLVVSLADVEGKSVYDPACGSGVFLAEAALEGAASLKGSDLNSRAVTRAKLLTFFSTPDLPMEITVEDSLLGAGLERHDRIVCAPPFGMRLPRRDMEGYAQAFSSPEVRVAPGGSYGEDYFIAKALSDLAEGGVAVVHVLSSFLFHQQKARRELRGALVSQGHISAVVELPGSCAPGTAVKTALVVLTKEPHDDNVLLIDAASRALEGKDYFEQPRRMCVPTDAGIDWIVDTVRNRTEIPEVSVLVSRERIAQTDDDLCYATYGDVPALGVSSRPKEDILADIENARRAIDVLDDQIEKILTALRQDGR